MLYLLPMPKVVPWLATQSDKIWSSSFCGIRAGWCECNAIENGYSTRAEDSALTSWDQWWRSASRVV